MIVRLALCAAFAASLSTPVLAQSEPFEGYLCCNMRSDGSWISDSNYAEGNQRVIPAGTPVKVTGYGRQRVYVEIDGKKQAIGNDYSRNLDLKTFAQRYVVSEDPRAKLATFSPKVRAAIEASQLLPGMTREQVWMAAGYPMASENPDLSAKIWRFWRSSFNEFQVVFDAAGKVKDIVADPATRTLVVAE
ncbi:hypothetical protein OOT46_23770 [Aquabacterium sp. A7-Y]|uniref:hypothetical protein n=1 Tax=Aquabacterium sp. A7-Y TaxID=1349605 RepID=UPI00223D8BC6|nr:hypothetical protein [Aquabacterium sp. A7-Y]MCW7540843.1 hypothetical protein [Aquabacterium sp. A7-Y]